MTDITLGIAFIAGLVSFISPCVLPLVPAYVGYMGGRLTTQVAAIGVGGQAVVRAQRNRFGTFLHSVFFVLGFTFVFVAFGIILSAGSLALRGSVVDLQQILGRLGGLIILLFGLHVMGALPRVFAWVIGKSEQMNTGVGYLLALLAQVGIAAALAWALVTPLAMLIGVGLYLAWLALGGAFARPGDFWQRTLTRLQTLLYMDTRRQMQPRSDYGYLGSALMGVVFSAGWTPCIGPVYGAVLTMAANGGSLSQAGALLAAYSLGLGVPFLLTALALDQMQGLLRRLQRHMRAIELVSGAFLLLIGFLVLTGQLQQFSAAGASGEFSLNLEHCTTELFAGRLPLAEFGACMDAGLGYIPAAERETSAPPVSANPGNPGESILGSVPALGGDAATGPSVIESVPALGNASPSPEVGLAVGFSAPDFHTTTYTGQEVSLSDYRGEAVLINFWATWCAPCRVEMADFRQVLAERGDEGFIILALSMGDTSGQVSAFADELGIPFPLLLDQDMSIAATYQVDGLPTSYLVDADGIIVARHQGPLTAAQLNAYLDRALAGS